MAAMGIARSNPGMRSLLAFCRFLVRHWLLWLLVVALMLYAGLRQVPNPAHGPYALCDTCALSTPIPDAATIRLIQARMPRAYNLPWFGALVGANFVVCNPGHCAEYRMTLDRRFISGPLIARTTWPGAGPPAEAAGCTGTAPAPGRGS